MKIGITGRAVASPNNFSSGWTVPWSTSMLADMAMSTPADRTAFAQATASGFGNVERPVVGAVVADPLRVGADAERWHQLVEEAVVVVGGEDDDELRVEAFDEFPCLRERAVDVVKEVLRRPGQIQQRAVGHTAQGYAAL